MKTPFGTEQTQADSDKRRSRMPLFVVGGIVLSLLVGATFAASITINGGDPIEFGQGKQLTTACDDAITPTISTTTYSEGTIEGTLFRVEALRLSNVNFNTCSGKTFTVRFLDSTGEEVGVCGGPTGCTTGDINAGYAIVKFTLGTCDNYGDCFSNGLVYFPNPLDPVEGGNNGLATVFTNVVTAGAQATTTELEDGWIDITFVWDAADTVSEVTPKYYMVRADQVAGFTIETS
jgi:hypothetical protein